MKLTFLCEMHREQLESKTAQAIRFWQGGFDTAKFLMINIFGKMQFLMRVVHLKLQKS